MDKEKMIERWMDIANAVFCAEDAISGEWEPKLEAAKNLPQKELHQVAMDYLRAIATEIVEHSNWELDETEGA